MRKTVFKIQLDNNKILIVSMTMYTTFIFIMIHKKRIKEEGESDQITEDL